MTVSFISFIRSASYLDPVAENLSLENGLLFESKLYHATFGMNDAHEGFSAFIEKRVPKWANS